MNGQQKNWPCYSPKSPRQKLFLRCFSAGGQQKSRKSSSASHYSPTLVLQQQQSTPPPLQPKQQGDCPQTHQQQTLGLPLQPPSRIPKLNNQYHSSGAVAAQTRLQELNQRNRQLTQLQKSFDAMCVLVQYMAGPLDAFHHPGMLARHKRLERHVMDLRSQIDLLSSEVARIQEQAIIDLVAAEDKFRTVFSGIRNDYEVKLAEADEVNEELQSRLLGWAEDYDHVQRVVEDKEAEQRQLRQDLNEFQDRIGVLECDNDSLHSSLEEARRQRKPVSPSVLEAEVTSLQCVLDMRCKDLSQMRIRVNELECRKLEHEDRKYLLDRQQQKIEELQALVDKKQETERQLVHDKAKLRQFYEKESKANKRLSMEKEQLEWRLYSDLDNLSEQPCMDTTHAFSPRRRPITWSPKDFEDQGYSPPN